MRDLRVIVDHVKDSDALLLFQSKEVLHRPWCLIELNTAIAHGVPIIALNCNGKEYDFVEAVDFMHHLETSLKNSNPSALEVLEQQDVDPIRLAHKLWSVIPNIISIPFNTSASENAIKATIADLVKAVASAEPLPIREGFETWLENRKLTDKLVAEQVLKTGTIRGTQRGRMLQKLVRADEMTEELREARAALAAKVEKNDAERAEHDAALAAKDAAVTAVTAAKDAALAAKDADHKTALNAKDAELKAAHARIASLTDKLLA